MPTARSVPPVVRLAIAQRLLALLAIVAAGVGGIYFAAPVKSEAQAPVTSTAAPAPAQPPAATSPASPAPLWAPGPKVPVEAVRLVERMEATYRCGHTLLQNMPAGQKILASSTGGELPSLDEIGKALTGLPDLCYPSAALPRLANPRTPPALMRALFDDLTKRPEQIRLPTLLMLAGTASHPMAAAAHEELETILGEDLAQDWPHWEAAIDEHLTRIAHGIRNANCRFH
jgi:hypothetical protein